MKVVIKLQGGEQIDEGFGAEAIVADLYAVVSRRVKHAVNLEVEDGGGQRRVLDEPWVCLAQAGVKRVVHVSEQVGSKRVRQHGEENSEDSEDTTTDTDANGGDKKRRRVEDTTGPWAKVPVKDFLQLVKAQDSTAIQQGSLGGGACAWVQYRYEGDGGGRLHEIFKEWALDTRNATVRVCNQLYYQSPDPTTPPSEAECRRFMKVHEQCTGMVHSLPGKVDPKDETTIEMAMGTAVQELPAMLAAVNNQGISEARNGEPVTLLVYRFYQLVVDVVVVKGE